MKKPFPIVEVILSIVALGVIVVLIYLPKNDLAEAALDAAARKVQSDIRYAQQLAVENNQVYGLVFKDGTGYHLYMSQPGGVVTDPVTGKKLYENFRSFAGVTLGSNVQIDFAGDGRVVTRGDSSVKLIGSDGFIRDIYVSEKSGKTVVNIVESGGGFSGCNLQFYP